VVAETGAATLVSNELSCSCCRRAITRQDGGQAQVDRLTARGHVTLTSEGGMERGAVGVYSESGEYVLTEPPPRPADDRSSAGNVWTGKL